MCAELAGRVKERFKPDVVIGIARDGLIPTVEVAELLGISYGFVGIKRDGIISRSITHPIRIIKRMNGIDAVTGLDVLMIDDVYNTGISIETAERHVKYGRPKSVRNAVLRYTRSEGRSDGPDFWITDDARIAFPWESSRYPNFFRSYAESKQLLPELGSVWKKRFEDRYRIKVHRSLKSYD
jgi:hypoxanthine phosphoribosyltransferase